MRIDPALQWLVGTAPSLTAIQCYRSRSLAFALSFTTCLRLMEIAGGRTPISSRLNGVCMRAQKRQWIQNNKCLKSIIGIGTYEQRREEYVPYSPDSCPFRFRHKIVREKRVLFGDFGETRRRSDKEHVCRNWDQTFLETTTGLTLLFGIFTIVHVLLEKCSSGKVPKPLLKVPACFPVTF